ncbi:MAG: Zn-ribbon domain-containing OB-fold protein [Minwuia sp.]|uniref:Zn-ribbon domain-containing OB-fold protein n=1 Tax=Minwuia sp. TaxID=2493630 RepID=UPI003A882592
MSDEGLSGVKPESEYKAFLAEGRFMLLRSRSSGRFMFYPRVAEPRTGATDLEWVKASGRGTVYSATAINQRPPAEAYSVALIDLEEGPRMMSRVEGVPAEDVRIGMAVTARIADEDGAPVVVFDPA